MPTIKQLADALGVTKPTITQRLKDLGMWDGHVIKSGPAYTVDDLAAGMVADAFGKVRKKSSEPSLGSAANKDASEAYSVAIEALKTALDTSQNQQAALERQLDAKDQQIHSLTEQLASAQAIIASLSSRS